MSQIKTRLQVRVDKREAVKAKRDALYAEADGGNLSETDAKTDELYREEMEGLDKEIEQLLADSEAEDRAEETSKKIRRASLEATDGVDVENGKIYRTFSAYARDMILTSGLPSTHEIVHQFGRGIVEAAEARLQLLKRAPEHTLSADVPGLIPADHIAQIFRAIDSSRPLVASAVRVPLDRGSLTYPRLSGRPAVELQGTQKTVGNTEDLNVAMETATASTYNAGGNLSWQAINWSSPSALDLWFRVAAASYALLTEQDAATVVIADAQANDISSELDGTPTYEEYVAAIAAGAAAVYDATGRMADTLYFAPDEFFKFAALVPTAHAAAFLDGGVSLTGRSGSFAGLNIVVSRGLNAGVAIVGDRSGLLVAESPGAPVELRAVEAQIGGLQVGIIGAFEAVVVDTGAFSSLTAAS